MRPVVDPCASGVLTSILRTETQPAFYASFQYLEGRRIGVTKINDEVASRLDRDPANITLHPRYLPMLAPPLPWTEPTGGAYLVHGGMPDDPCALLHYTDTLLKLRSCASPNPSNNRFT